MNLRLNLTSISEREGHNKSIHHVINEYSGAVADNQQKQLENAVIPFLIEGYRVDELYISWKRKTPSVKKAVTKYDEYIVSMTDEHELEVRVWVPVLPVILAIRRFWRQLKIDANEKLID